MSCAERIPSEIVLHILKQLDNQNDLVNCVPVCKLWGYHALELLWYKPALNQPLNWIAFCASLQSRYHSLPYNSFIRRINLTPLSTHVEDYQIACLAKCQRFERITLAGCTSLTDKGLCSLMSQGACHDLLSLDLSDVFDITNVTLYKVAESCPKLQGLNLNMTRQTCRITDSGVAQLAMHCKELKRVNTCQNNHPLLD
jgi:F-box and leucine-rich repeat protein GRR1